MLNLNHSFSFLIEAKTGWGYMYLCTMYLERIFFVMPWCTLSDPPYARLYISQKNLSPVYYNFQSDLALITSFISNYNFHFFYFVTVFVWVRVTQYRTRHNQSVKIYNCNCFQCLNIQTSCNNLMLKFSEKIFIDIQSGPACMLVVPDSGQTPGQS